MSSISQSVDWSISTCEDPYVGYSQAHRNQEIVGGIVYYDCSSFVWYALLAGGFDMVAAYNNTYGGYYGNAMTTSQMDTILTYLGFVRYSPSLNAWQQGDIMWREGHTEIVYDPVNYYTMGAHSDSYPLAEQVSIAYVSTQNYWTYGYRYSPSSYRWYAQSTGGYLRESTEALNNAVMIYRILAARGWTVNAVSAILGNIEWEGGYNPWRWQDDVIIGTADMGSNLHGYGLFQFTPANKYINSTTATRFVTYNPNYQGHNGSPEDGDAQVKWVDESTDQYYATLDYPLSYSDFKVSTNTPEYLASVWLRNFERPASYSSEADRQQAARYWYGVLQDIPPTPPTPPVPPTPTRRKSPFWIYIYPF